MVRFQGSTVVVSIYLLAAAADVEAQKSHEKYHDQTDNHYGCYKLRLQSVRSSQDSSSLYPNNLHVNGLSNKKAKHFFL